MLWSGSALMQSTYLPSGGTNSCLDFSLAMNLVTINVKKFLAVIKATYAVAKRKPEKNGQYSEPPYFHFLIFFQAFFSQLRKLR